MNQKRHESTFTDNSQRAPFLLLFILALLLLALSAVPVVFGQEMASVAANADGAPAPSPAPSPRLLKVKRLCVQPFGSDALGMQTQEMVIARLYEANRFSLTEDCEHADYVLKGTISERNERVSRQESEGFGVSSRVSSSSRESSRVGSVGSSEGSSVSGSIAANANESLASAGYEQTAAVTLRLVDKQGEILWAVSMESPEGKTRGAIGEAAHRAVGKLLRDISRLEKPGKPGAKKSSGPKEDAEASDEPSDGSAPAKSSTKKKAARTARSPNSPAVKSGSASAPKSPA